MSEVETCGDADQKDVQDHPQQQLQQQQQSYTRQLSDDNPIENDVEHTSDDNIPAAGEKSASADSGAEEIGSPDQHQQQDTHAAGHWVHMHRRTAINCTGADFGFELPQQSSNAL